MTPQVDAASPRRDSDGGSLYGLREVPGCAQAAEVLLFDEEEPLEELLGLELSEDLVSEPGLLVAGVLLDDEPRLSVR
jgi:hypothetical protein